MDRHYKYTDTDIRLIILEYLTSTCSGESQILAIESKYGTSARRADILSIGIETHAYEIKSDVDTIFRLKDQLHDYRRTFDFLTVVTTKSKLSSVKKILGPKDGLIAIENGKVIEHKKAQRNVKLIKGNLAIMCSKQSLATALSLSYGKMKYSDLLKKAVKEISLIELRELSRLELIRRFQKRYYLFRLETCPPYRETDLKILKYGNTLHIGNALGSG